MSIKQIDILLNPAEATLVKIINRKEGLGYLKLSPDDVSKKEIVRMHKNLGLSVGASSDKLWDKILEVRAKGTISHAAWRILNIHLVILNDKGMRKAYGLDTVKRRLKGRKFSDATTRRVPYKVTRSQEEGCVLV